LNSRERLLAVLENKAVDRVPVSPFIQQEFMSEYFKRSDTDRVVDAAICAKELGFDLITKEYRAKPYFLRKSFNNWVVNEESIVENNNYFKLTTIETPEKTFKQIEGAPYKKDILTGIHFVTTEFMINSKEDFEIFAKYMPKQDDDYKRDIIDSGKFAKNYVGDLGINAPWCAGGVFNMVTTFINIQNMLMDAIIDNEYYDAYMRFFADILCEDVRCYVESDYDVIGMQGNMANGALMSGTYFEQYILPYEQRAIRIANEGNKPVLYHNCGCAKNLLPVYKKLGIKIYETIAAPPEGDSDLKEVKDLYAGTDIVLCGTFDQVNFLKKGKPEEIYKKAGEIMQIGKQGGNYIFAASDYIEQNTPLENVKAMLEGAKSQAQY